MQKLSKTPFADTIRQFHNAGIGFVIIGGVAMGLHGSNYMTVDTDFAYAVETENVERLAAFLASIHARVSGRPANDGFVITPGLLQRVKFLNLYTDLGQIDVLREIAGIDNFEGLRERAALMDLGGFVVQVASLDDLIAMKKAANRPKDQVHLFELLALKKLVAPTPETP